MTVNHANELPARALLLLLTATLPSCGGDAGTESPPTKQAAALTIVAGNNQTGTVGVYLPQILVVRVNDQSAQPLPGATVNWSITVGNGSVDHVSSLTGTDRTVMCTGRWVPRLEQTVGKKEIPNDRAKASGGETLCSSD